VGQRLAHLVRRPPCQLRRRSQARGDLARPPGRTARPTVPRQVGPASPPLPRCRCPDGGTTSCSRARGSLPVGGCHGVEHEGLLRVGRGWPDRRVRRDQDVHGRARRAERDRPPAQGRGRPRAVRRPSGRSPRAPGDPQPLTGPEAVRVGADLGPVGGVPAGPLRGDPAAGGDPPSSRATSAHRVSPGRTTTVRAPCAGTRRPADGLRTGRPVRACRCLPPGCSCPDLPGPAGGRTTGRATGRWATSRGRAAPPGAEGAACAEGEKGPPGTAGTCAAATVTVGAEAAAPGMGAPTARSVMPSPAPTARRTTLGVTAAAYRRRAAVPAHDAGTRAASTVSRAVAPHHDVRAMPATAAARAAASSGRPRGSLLKLAQAWSAMASKPRTAVVQEPMATSPVSRTREAAGDPGPRGAASCHSMQFDVV
jgi:hypothetical protein